MAGCRTFALLVLVFVAPAITSAATVTCAHTMVMSPAVKPLVDATVTDLAQRLRIPVSEVCVAEARTVVWPDRSLGCPRPGMLYPQVQQDGVFIRLEALGRSYPYHGGGSRVPFLCDSPERRDPPAAAGDGGPSVR